MNRYGPADRTPLREEELKQLNLEQQLTMLRSRHETLGGAYRGACEELTRLRKANEGYRARLDAVRVLCEVGHGG